MPELPEVETIRLGLCPALIGEEIAKIVVNRFDLRFSIPYDFAQKLEGQKIINITRRGKYLLLHLGNDTIWLIHLGMSGRVTLLKAAEKYLPQKHDHVIIMLNNGVKLIYNDVRRFGGMDIFPKAGLDSHRLLCNLGVEPLTDDLTADWLYNKLSTLNTNIKSALLNQKYIAGLGNIYVCEALYQAKISPLRVTRDITKIEANLLVKAIKSTLNAAIAAGGSSLKDYVQASGEMGYFQKEWAVYNKMGEACPDCDCNIGESGGIQRIKQAGRSSFYCSRKQK